MSAVRHLPALPPPGACPHEVLTDLGACEECGFTWDEIVAETSEEVALYLALQPYADGE